MTDDDFSELAEALEYACQASVKEGYTISRFEEKGHRSPFCALLGSGRGTPYPESVESITGIPASVVGAFNQGFLNSKRFPGFSVKAYNLGRQFRDQWASME